MRQWWSINVGDTTKNILREYRIIHGVTRHVCHQCHMTVDTLQWHTQLYCLSLYSEMTCLEWTDLPSLQGCGSFSLQMAGICCRWNNISCTVAYIYLYIYILIYKAPQGCNFRGTVSSQRWPKPSPVFIAPTHGGMARPSGLSGVDKYRDFRPAKCCHQSNYWPVLTYLNFVDTTNTVTTTSNQPP